MKQIRKKRVLLAAAALACGSLIFASTTDAREASGVVRRPSCTLVRYYVAIYSAPAAEAWARSKGATDADIQTARRCIASTNRPDSSPIAIN